MTKSKSVTIGFSSALVLMLALGGFATMASGQSASLSGTVQAGPLTYNPIKGATVNIYEAGLVYGAQAVSLGSTITDSDGNFTVPYTPPATPAVLYLIAHSGNAGFGSGVNSAIGLMGVAGISNALPSSVTINPLTTVAAEWALAQFIGSNGRAIGAPKSNSIGFDNAVNQSQANLVDIATGVPASFWNNQGANAESCNGSGGQPVNCGGLELLNTLANIMAACVESPGPSSSSCSTLLSTTASTNTLQAAHVMATNPFANVATLFTLGSLPFSPALSAPADWEMVLYFGSTGTGIAIDAVGNVWVTSPCCISQVSEFNSSGGLIGTLNNANFRKPKGVAIDAADNVWIANSSGNNVTELNSSGSQIGNFNNTNTPGAKFNGPQGVAIDTAGNAWVTDEGKNGVGGTSVTELSSTGDLLAAFDNSNTPGANFSSPSALAFDLAGNAWVANAGSRTKANEGSVTELTSNGALVGNFNPTGADFANPQGMAIDALGDVWFANCGNGCNGSAGSVTELNASGGLVGNFNSSNTPGGNFINPSGVAVDGAGNAWVVGSFFGALTELTSSGTVAGTFSPTGMSLAIDAAGNVWTTDGSELIGAARPVLTPLVACLNRTPPSTVCLP